MNLLSGLARCGKFGHPINGKKGSDKRYYTCLGRMTLKTCDCALMGAPALEETVLGLVKQRLSVENVRDHMRMVEEKIQADVAARAHAVDAQVMELGVLEQRLAKLEDDYFRGDLDGRTYGRMLERVEAERDRIFSQLEGARKALAEARRATVDVGHLESLAARIDVWETLTPESLKQMLHDVVDAILIYQQKSHSAG